MDKEKLIRHYACFINVSYPKKQEDGEEKLRYRILFSDDLELQVAEGDTAFPKKHISCHLDEEFTNLCKEL